MLLDEADQILLDNAATLRHKRVFALSATPFTEDMVFEKQFLEQSKFKCIDSMIPGAIGPIVEPKRASLDAFFEKTEGYARIIYSTDAHNPTPTTITMTDCDDLPRLKLLTKDDVLLITKRELSRGIDYRAAEGTVGLALLVMSSVASERAYVQLLGRVGRYNETCMRFLWD